MNYFENSSQRLNPKTLQRFIVNQVSNIDFKSKGREKIAPDLSFSSNEEFWGYIIKNGKIVKLHNVSLEGFRVSSWFPRVPGIYHTLNAMSFRDNAKNYLVASGNDIFYNPSGKSSMVRGGVGSVKFQPINHENELFWLCTATSDFYCHTGVPLFIPNSIYENIDLDSSAEYVLLGRIKFLPSIIDTKFRHYVGLPKIYVQVESIKEKVSKSRKDELVISPVVYFKSSELAYDSASEDLVTFAVCNAGRKYNAEEVFEWFIHYAKMYNGRIMTNFDEQSPLFEDAPFSLQKVMSGEILISQVQNLFVDSPLINFRVNTMNTGNSISIGDGNTINGNLVAAHSVVNSFLSMPDRVAQNPQLEEIIKDFQEETKIFVQNLVSKKEADTVSRDVKGFCEEASAEEPREGTLNHYLKSIGEVAIKAGVLGAKLVNIVSTLSPLVKVIAEHASN